MIQYLKKLLFDTWILAAIPAVIAFLFLHPSENKYKISVESNYMPGFMDICYDLNHDGISEIFGTGKGVPLYYVLVMDHNYNIYDQWNLEDFIDNDLGTVFFGDYDSDNSGEIYIFTYRDDSLYLNVNEFFQPSGTHIDGRFITKICNLGGKVTSNVYPAGFYDNDGDGIKELYFSINTGFGLEPRIVCFFNFATGALQSSDFAGVTIVHPQLTDIDGDGKPEIFGETSASGNYNTPVLYQDNSTWLMVYKSNLSFKFPPVEFPGFTNYLQTELIKEKDTLTLVVSNATTSADKSIIPGIGLFKPDGKLLKFRKLEELGVKTTNVRMSVIDERIFLSGSGIIELNKDLEVINSASPLNTRSRIFTQDINGDGEVEIMLYSDTEIRMVILNTSLKKMCETQIDLRNLDPAVSHFAASDKQHRLFMSVPGIKYILDLKTNKYYYAGYLAYPGVYLFFVLLIFFVKKLNTIQIVEKEELKQRLLKLQLKAIKSQLDPHFTFNTLNSVASLIYFNERQDAYDYLTKFTSLLRNMLSDAELIYRTIDDEIIFVRTYLELEKLRFGDKFSYSIESSSEVRGNEEVPKLVLFTFAENAIKHGLIPNDKAGMLRINIDRINGELKISIEDNGIGRKKSEGQSTSTKKGLKLTTEFYEILNNMDHGRVQYHITDMYDSAGIASGTRVDVLIELAQTNL